jgi:hypothetical protein
VSVQPIRPDQAAMLKASTIPLFVIEAFNELIVENLTSGGRAVVTKTDAVVRIQMKSPSDLSREEIIRRRWLDIEPIFEAYGWKVKYDKPGFTESYDDFFEFVAAG